MASLGPDPILAVAKSSRWAGFHPHFQSGFTHAMPAILFGHSSSIEISLSSMIELPASTLADAGHYAACIRSEDPVLKGFILRLGARCNCPARPMTSDTSLTHIPQFGTHL